MLVDTNIVSYFFTRGDTRAALYEPHLKSKTLFISFITVAELYRWPIERSWSDENKQRLVHHLRSYAVLPFEWAELTVILKKAGSELSWGDSWIAATALRHNMALVTHNRKHFEKAPGLTLISENNSDV